LTSSEGPEGSARVVVPHHQLPPGGGSQNHVRTMWLLQLRHMQAALKITASNTNNELKMNERTSLSPGGQEGLTLGSRSMCQLPVL